MLANAPTLFSPIIVTGVRREEDTSRARAEKDLEGADLSNTPTTEHGTLPEGQSCRPRV